MDPVRAGIERGSAKRHVIVLADGEDREAGAMGHRDRRKAVVRPSGQIHDHLINRREGGLQRRLRAYGDRGGIRSTDQVGKSRGPDQIVSQDGDPGAQPNASAR
jgi:hypothetical protein